MKKHKILIIDDEANLTKMLKLNLDETGEFETQTLNDSEKAINVINQYMPDLILLDVMMPGIPGNEIASLILEDDEISHIKIIFLTAIVTNSDISEENNTIGGRKFIAKPVNIDKLLSIINEELEQ